MQFIKIFLFLVLLICSVGLSSAIVSYTGGEIQISSGSETPTSINSSLNNTSLFEQLSEKEWVAKKPIRIMSGGTLWINSSDTSWLKLNKTCTYVYNNGILNVDYTKITSWDTSSNNIMTSSSSARPYFRTSTNTMNLQNSNMSYLGYAGATDWVSGIAYDNGVKGWKINNMTIVGNRNGLYSQNSGDAIVTNVTIKNNAWRAMLFDASVLHYNFTISNNNFINGGNGGLLFQGRDSVIENNTATGGNSNINIVWGAYNNTIRYNTIYNSHPHAAIDIHCASSVLRARNNTIYGNHIYDLPSYGGTNPHGIYLHNYQGYGNIVYDNVISNITGSGIHIYHNNNNTLYNNTVTAAAIGLNLAENSYNNIDTNSTYYLNTYNVYIENGASENELYCANTSSYIYSNSATSSYTQIIDAPKNFCMGVNNENHETEIIFTNGKVFTAETYPVKYHPTKSNTTVTGVAEYVNIVLKSNFMLVPDFSYLESVTINRDNTENKTITVDSSITENPTIIKFQMNNATNNYDIYKNSVFYTNCTSDSNAIIQFNYNSPSSEFATSQIFNIIWTSNGYEWSPTSGKLYFSNSNVINRIYRTGVTYPFTQPQASDIESNLKVVII